ncbi:hypothetical protein JCM1840_007104 [Sporobolomyces johnsonii]
MECGDHVRPRALSRSFCHGGPYWLPLDLDLGLPSEDDSKVKPAQLVDLPKPRVSALELPQVRDGDTWWNYLVRCTKSGSMRNRKRIWDVVRQIEHKADEMDEVVGF